MSSFEWIEFIAEDWIAKYTNITTKLKWKLFTKVIRRPSEERGLGWIDRLKEKHKQLNLECG